MAVIVDYLLPLIIVVVVSVPLAIAIRRSTDLFVLEVNRGAVRFVRGRIPQALLDELTEVLQRAKSNGRLRVFVERQEARIDARGNFTDATLQQLRNVIGNTPLQRIRAGGRPKRP